MDTLARSKLREQGLDYAHGTGHAVGSFLGVHESKWHITLHIPTNKVQHWTVKCINFKDYPYFGRVGSKAVLCDLDERVLIVLVT